jgi:hypothetical protein
MKKALITLCLLVAVLALAIPQSARTPPESYGIALADLNGDGNLDAVVTNMCTTQADCTNGSVSVFLGNGDGTFQAGLIYSSGGYGAFRVAIADLNGDGHPDIVVANACISASNCSSGSVGVLLGNGDGTFKPAVSYPSGGMYAYSVAIGSLRESSKLDLIVANVCQTGSSTCTKGAQNLNLGVQTFCTSGSLNCANVNGAVGILLGNGDGTFASAVSYGSGGVGTFSVATGIFNGSNLSVAATNSCATTSDCSHGTVAVLLGNGDGTLQSAVAYSTGGLDPEFVVVGDFNGDSKPDLAVINDCATSFASACPHGLASANNSSFGILLGHGDGTFGSVVNYSLSGEWPVSSAAAADVNADGKLDLIIGQRMAGGDDVAVALGNGDGTFQSPVYYAGTDFGNTSPVAIGDVNGDSKPDVVFTNLYNFGSPATGGHWPNDSAYSLLGNGDGTFSPTNVIFTPNPLAFGTVTSGTKIDTFTVTNLSGSTKSVTFNGTPTITGTGAGQFSVLPYVSGSQSTCLQTSPTKIQLQPGATCTFTVQFTSTGLGTSYNVTLNVSDNGAGGSQPVSMTAKD